MFSIQKIVIDSLLCHFPDIVYENVLPLPDSHVTNQEYGFVVSEVSDTKTAESCTGSANRSIIDVTIYEREDCGVVGSLNTIGQFVTGVVRSIPVAETAVMRISAASYVAARNLPYIRDDFRARTLTYALDYEVYNYG